MAARDVSLARRLRFDEVRKRLEENSEPFW